MRLPVYLDYAATTPVDPVVAEAIRNETDKQADTQYGQDQYRFQAEYESALLVNTTGYLANHFSGL